MEEAVQNTGEETPAVDSPTAEPQTTPPVEEPQEQPTDEAQEAPTVSTTEETTTEEVKPKSQNRFQELANNLRETSEQLEKERTEKTQLLQQLTPQQQTGVQFDPNKEYTIDEYQGMLQKAQNLGAASSNLEVQKLRQEWEAKEQRRSFEGTLQQDIGYLENTYPELNEKDSKYNSVLHREITEAYQESAVAGEAINPNVSLKSIGDRIMRAAQNAAATASVETGQEVASQASAAVQQEGARGQITAPGTKEWMQSKYDPQNPEHRKIADQYVAQHQYK